LKSFLKSRRSPGILAHGPAALGLSAILSKDGGIGNRARPLTGVRNPRQNPSVRLSASYFAAGAKSDKIESNEQRRGEIMKRRDFVKWTLTGAAALPIIGCETASPPEEPPPDNALSPLFRVSQIADDALTVGNHHTGVDALLRIMGENGLKFYRSALTGPEKGSRGLISSGDVVLLKVNAQWKYRGCTNSDLIRGLVQRILEHPDGFTGEVVIVENGQGRGSLACDTSSSYNNADVHANAQDESHSFLWLVDHLFQDPRVSAYILDSVRSTFITADDHLTDGYRTLENVSYPCFTTAGGRRVELKEGIWNGSAYENNLKLINVPVLKHHDTGGSEITGALKHVYGLVSMADGQSGFRHYSGLGETCGKMMVSVHTPVLNLMDAIWVSHGSLGGYPASTTFRANEIVASQDPVALDFWAAKYILYPHDNNDRHHPGFSGIDRWLTDARDLINGRGGFDQSDRGISVRNTTKTESRMVLHQTVP
jgi:uncharacterized protein (DUF362 family)